MAKNNRVHTVKSCCTRVGDVPRGKRRYCDRESRATELLFPDLCSYYAQARITCLGFCFFAQYIRPLFLYDDQLSFVPTKTEPVRITVLQYSVQHIAVDFSFI